MIITSWVSLDMYQIQEYYLWVNIYFSIPLDMMGACNDFLINMNDISVIFYTYQI